MEEIYLNSIEALVEKIQQGELTCVELINYYVDRIERYGGKEGLNCVLSINPKAMEMAQKLDLVKNKNLPLFGIPFLVKDNIDISGMVSSGGSRALIDNFAYEHAAIVSRLINLGAIPLGKTNMTELANFVTQGMPGGYSSYGGEVKHAYDKRLTPGGSSSGSAVAIAASLVPFTLGTDTSFSVVGCASENGIVGFKFLPSNVSLKGVIPISYSLDSLGVFTNDIEELIYVYQAYKGSLINKETPILFENIFGKEIVASSQLSLYKNVQECLKQEGVIIKKINQPSTPLLKELLFESYYDDMNAYLKVRKCVNSDFLSLYTYYEEHPDTMKKYGDSYLEEAIIRKKSLENTNKRKDLEKEQLKKEKQLLQEVGDNVIYMTGPTCIMHFVRWASLSLPIGENADGIPKNMILYCQDEERLLSMALLIEKKVSKRRFLTHEELLNK